MSENAFLKKIENGVLTITINRPDKRNALTLDNICELADIFKNANTQDDVHCIIITGSGDYFCSGWDVSGGDFNFEDLVLNAAEEDYDSVNQKSPGSQMCMSILNCLKPVIAAINGPAAGVGATILLPMDFVLLSESAKIGYVFPKRGVIPEAGSTYLLPLIIGLHRASDWLLTGRLIEPAEAKEAGLARSIHQPHELMEAAHQLADELVTTCSSVSLACARRLLWGQYVLEGVKNTSALESLCFYELAQKSDAKEGIQSFLEKRPPEFKARVSEDLPKILRR